MALEFSQLTPVIGVAASIMTPLFGGIWLLISKFQRAQIKIKHMEADKVLASVRSLDKKIAEHKEAIKSHGQELIKNREELIKVQAKIEFSVKAEEHLLIQFQKMTKDVEDRLKTVESTLDNCEMVKLGPNSIMIRAKKKSSVE